MILDQLKNLKSYAALNPRIGQVVSFLENTDLAGLADGRYEIDGKDVYVTVGTYPLKNPADAALEAHDNYIDIQAVIDGSEGFGWRWREHCTQPRGEMNTVKDIIFYEDRPSATVTANSGEFVIFFTDDAHAPLTDTGSDRKDVRKCVFKVKK